MEYQTGILIPVYRATPALPVLLDEIASALPAGSYHIYIIDDSGEETTGRFLAQNCLLSTVTLIRLTHNFGQQNALLCGIRAAVSHCDILATMDDDGQHDPALLPVMLAALPRQNALLYALSPIRHGSPVMRGLGSRARDLLFRVAMGVPRGKRVGSYRLISHDLALRLANWEGEFFYLSAAALRMRPQIINIEAPARPRVCGRSGYTPRKLTGLYLNLLWYSALGMRLPRKGKPYLIESITKGAGSQ